MPNHTNIKLRRGTAAEWRAANELLLLGEPGFEKDTYRLKIGDGITLWNDLPYIDGGFGGQDGPLEYIYDVNMGSPDNINPGEISFDSLNNNIDYSSLYSDILDNEYVVSLKLTKKTDPNTFLIAKSTSGSRNYNTGNISVFWPSSSVQWIIDGGDDQYDSANFINNNITTPNIPNESAGSSTLRSTSIPYNSGLVREQSQYWGANDYVTLYKKNIFAMVSYGNSATMPHTVYYSGNTGADGDGNKDTGTLTNYNGYQAGYCRIWGDDPTYTKLIVTKTGTVPTYSTDIDNDTNDDLFVAAGINSDTIAMIVFYADDTSNPSSVENIQDLFESFVDNVLVGAGSVSDMRTNFYNNHSTIYDTVDPSFWYPDFEFFTGTNNGNANIISAEGGSGSGLAFSVVVNQDTMQYDFSIDSIGINYQSGDTVVLRGNNLDSPDGRSPDEDIYIIIDSVDTGGEVLTYSTIANFAYTFNIDQILARSDGFRFVDNQTYYLNIDVIGGGADLDTAAVSGIALNVINDALNTSLIAGSGISLDYDSGTDTLTISASTSGSITLEEIHDNLGTSFLVAGSGITLSYNDAGDSLTISSEEAAKLVTNVFNKTGSPIPKFSVVYISGGQGDQPTISLASASSEATSSKTYGITAEAIGNMSAGKVIVYGALTGVNTDQFNPTAPTGDVNGTTLYLSPTTPGGVTTTKPSAPNHMVAVGTIVRTHQNEGIVEVRVQNGYELEELHNVAISGVTDGQYLKYNGTSKLWVPGTVSAGVTVANNSDNRILTCTSSTTSINGEANLTFDGSTLSVSGDVTIDNININGNSISSINSNGNITLAPNGTGDVQIDADTLRVGDSNAVATITTNGTGNLVLNTNAGTNSGSITIAQGSNGNITIAPNGTGDVYIDADTLRVGDSNSAATITTNGTGNLTISTNSGTNSGSIVINQGSNGNIAITPNGTGEVDLSKVDINGGSIDGTAIGANSASTGKFTQLYPTVVSNGSVSGSVGTDVSTGQIFDMTLTGATTLSNPTNAVDGVTVRWRITQDGTGGHTVNLDTKFQIPSSASSPLPWSTTSNATDILAATYHAGRDKWDVVAFVPGY